MSMDLARLATILRGTVPGCRAGVDYLRGTMEASTFPQASKPRPCGLGSQPQPCLNSRSFSLKLAHKFLGCLAGASRPTIQTRCYQLLWPIPRWPEPASAS